MATVPAETLRDNLKEVIDFVRFKGGKVLITRRGYAVAEIVPAERPGELIKRRPRRLSQPDSQSAEPARDMPASA